VGALRGRLASGARGRRSALVPRVLGALPGGAATTPRAHEGKYVAQAPRSAWRAAFCRSPRSSTAELGTAEASAPEALRECAVRAARSAAPAGRPAEAAPQSRALPRGRGLVWPARRAGPTPARGRLRHVASARRRVRLPAGSGARWTARARCARRREVRGSRLPCPYTRLRLGSGGRRERGQARDVPPAPPAPFSSRGERWVEAAPSRPRAWGLARPRSERRPPGRRAGPPRSPGARIHPRRARARRVPGRGAGALRPRRPASRARPREGRDPAPACPEVPRTGCSPGTTCAPRGAPWGARPPSTSSSTAS